LIAMTLIGCWLGVDRAYVWAYSEGIWRGDDGPRSNGHAHKVVVNDRARLAGAGAGDRGNRYIAEGVGDAESFEQLFAGLPAHLREWAIERRLATMLWPDWTAVCTGYSRRLCRMVGVALMAERDFVPTLIGRSYLLPQVDADEINNIIVAEDIVPIALRQFAELKKRFPMLGVGTLQVAEIWRHETRMHYFDLPLGTPLQAPDLAPMGTMNKQLECSPSDRRVAPGEGPPAM
jgi:hypothetical protein